MYASRGSAILVGEAGKPMRVLAHLPLGGKDTFCASVRLLGRLSRRHMYHVVPFHDRVVSMGFGRIWCLDAKSGALVAPPCPLVGGRPLALCVTPHGLYYGEYRNNKERSGIRVFFSADGLRWEQVRELRGVRHIHGVYYDAFSDCIWVTTGDENEESAIWRTTDRFATLEPVVRGSQQARAISLVFTHDHLYFGSDTPLEQNYLHRLSRRTGEVSTLAPVEGSVFHGARVGNWLLFSTAVEPSKINRSRDAVLYASPEGERWQSVARQRKDVWHMSYFQYGQLVLPSGNNETGRFWFSAFAAGNDDSIYAGTFDGG
jgi:hypothetical protein